MGCNFSESICGRRIIKQPQLEVRGRGHMWNFSTLRSRSLEKLTQVTSGCCYRIAYVCYLGMIVCRSGLAFCTLTQRDTSVVGYDHCRPTLLFVLPLRCLCCRVHHISVLCRAADAYKKQHCGLQFNKVPGSFWRVKAEGNYFKNTESKKGQQSVLSLVQEAQRNRKTQRHSYVLTKRKAV